MSATDQELVERARRGDNAAFSQLWTRHQGRVAALCRRYLAAGGDPAVDEHDLAAEAFICALHHLDRYEDRSRSGAGFGAWLLELAARVCLTFLAKQRRRRRWNDAGGDALLAGRRDPGPPVEAVVARRELLRRAAQEINALPTPYRAPFKLYLEGYSHREIAGSLALSVEAAMKRVQRARRLLRPRVADLLGMPEVPPPNSRRRRAARPGDALWTAVERTLSDIVTDCRIVTLTLPGGGEMQLWLRVDRTLAGRETEIEARRACLAGRARAWRQWLVLAELCYHSGRWSEATEAYRAVLAARPACFPAALALGEMLQRAGRAPEAAGVYRAALEQSPPPAVAERLQAHLLTAEGRDAEAVEAFRRTLVLAPEERRCYLALSTALGRLSRYQDQLEVLAALRERDPEDLHGWVGAYTPCAHLGRFDLARPLLERAVALDGNDPMAVKHLFQVRMNLDLLDRETEELAERLVRLAPRLTGSWAELSWFHREVGREEESLAILRQCVAEHPENAEAHAALAWGCHYAGRLEERLIHARRAYALTPEAQFIRWTLLVALHSPEHVGEEEALGHAEEIAARAPSDAFLLREVARLYRAWGRETEALEYARRAVALNPSALAMLDFLARSYFHFRRYEAAEAAFARILALPGSRTFRHLLGWSRTLGKLRDPREAAAAAELETLTASDWQRLQLALYHEERGRRSAALAAFRACLASGKLQTRDRSAAEAGIRRLAGSPP